jgi:hypothetical protein
MKRSEPWLDDAADDQALDARIAQLRAACDIVRSGAAPSVSVTCPRTPETPGLVALATGVAATLRLQTTIALAGQMVTIRIGREES